MRLAYRRARARVGAVALVAIGTAIAAGALATLLTARVVVEDKAVADAVAAFPADQRVVAVSWTGNRAQELPGLDREARQAVQSLGLGAPTRAVAFRSMRLGGELVRLAALDDLADLVELRSGRAPAACGPTVCELVALDGPNRELEAQGFAVVGRVTRRDGAPLDSLIGSRAAGERLLLASGVDGLLAQPVLGSLYRARTWLVPLDPNALDAAHLDEFERRIAREGTRLRVRSPGFAVRAPLQELSAVGDRAGLASRRQLIVAGQFVALFLAFAVLAASRIQRDARETRYRLRRFGALRWQALAETTAHAGIVVVPSVVLGWIVGVGVGAGVAAASDRPVGSVLERSSLSGFGLQTALALAALAVAAIVVTVRGRSIDVRGLRLTPADVAAAGAIAVVVAAFASGQDAAANVEGSGTLLLLLPILIAFAAAVVAGRLLGPVFRLAGQVAPKARVSTRLAVLSLVRNPGPAALAVVFLVVATGLAVFAETYRATLEANQRDAAAYAVPLEYVVRRDVARSRGLGAPTPLADAYRGGNPVGVIRRAGDAPTLNRTERLTVLGLPAAAIERLRWREDYADDPRPELAKALAFGGRTELQGVHIPAGARQLVFPATVRGDPIRILADVRRRDGGFVRLELPESGTLRLPRGLPGGRLVGLTLEFPPGESFTAAHRATGRRPTPDVFVGGTLRLGIPRADGRPLAVDYRDWVRLDGSGTGGSRKGLTLRYLLTQERAFRIRPRQVTDARPVPVIASASIAAAVGVGAVLPLDVGAADIETRVTASAARFPTIRGDFLVADRDALDTALNAAVPGVAVADEVWLAGAAGREDQLRRAAPVPVRVASRATILERLRADPVSRASALSLIAGTLVALALALAGVLLAVAVDLRDEVDELFDLEAIGLSPPGLARHVWLRSLLVVALGLAGGVVTGAGIAFVVSDVVALTANATTAEPPLRLVADWPVLLVGLFAFAAVAFAAAIVLARSAFREPAA